MGAVGSGWEKDRSRMTGALVRSREHRARRCSQLGSNDEEVLITV